MRLALTKAVPAVPGDAAYLEAFLAAAGGGEAGAALRRLFVFGKTAGPATLQDASRPAAQAATDAAIRAAGGAALLERSWRLFSTGCEGIAGPISVAVADLGTAPGTADTDADTDAGEGLVVGGARSQPLPEAGRCARPGIMIAADCVRAAMESAGLAPAQVALVLVKYPVERRLTGSRHAEVTGSARGAGALGAALALGEIAAAELPEDPVGASALQVSRTMCFSGTETECVEAIVLGHRPGGDAGWRLDTTVLADLMDAPALAAIRAPEGYRPWLVFFKAGLARDGRIRGRQTAALLGDIPADKHLRAAASGLLGALLPDADTFISGGAEHQGPEGSCLCAILWERVAA